MTDNSVSAAIIGHAVCNQDFSFWDAPVLIKLAAVLLLSLFMVLTAYTFQNYVAAKKKEELESMSKKYRLDEFQYFSADAVRGTLNFKKEDYNGPIFFATSICILGFTALLLGVDLKIACNPNLLFAGFKINYELSELQLYQTRSLMVIATAFLGAYVWSVSNILTRVVTLDLTPGAYYIVSIRLVLACAVALTLRHLVGMSENRDPAIPTNFDYLSESLPVLAFLTGMFPQSALRFIREQSQIFREKPNRDAHRFSLNMIEGITVFRRVRLSELGIENAQNLSVANPVELALKSPFKLLEVVDWIGQAQLYVKFKAEVLGKLRRAHIRTIFDFTTAGEMKKLRLVAKQTGLSADLLELVYSSLKKDMTFQRLRPLYERLGEQKDEVENGTEALAHARGLGDNDAQPHVDAIAEQVGGGSGYAPA